MVQGAVMKLREVGAPKNGRWGKQGLAGGSITVEPGLVTGMV